MAATQDKAVEESQRIIAELRRERNAALAREAALTEVLDLINRSPGNPELVFETILEKAHTLCGAAIGALSTYDGTLMHTLAMRGFPDDYAGRMREPWPPSEATTQRLIEGANVVHIQDLVEIERGLGLMTGRSDMQTTLAVPLRKDAAFLGQITAFRAEVRPFAVQEIALLESFAAQAVIALENARLVGELREYTEALSNRNIAFAERIGHQAATIDVLKAISASTGDPRPVFDLIVRQAIDACNGLGAALFEYDGAMVHCRSIYAPTFPPEALNAYRGLYPMAPTRN